MLLGQRLNVIGTEDRAWRGNLRQGTMIIRDLERRWIMALPPDREIAAVQAWLADRHPSGSIEVVNRTRRCFIRALGDKKYLRCHSLRGYL